VPVFAGQLEAGEHGGTGPALTAADERDDVAVVEHAVEDGGGDRHILEEFAPILERAVGVDEDRFLFVAPHDDLEEVLAGVLRQILGGKVLDDQILIDPLRGEPPATAASISAANGAHKLGGPGLAPTAGLLAAFAAATSPAPWAGLVAAFGA